MPQTHLAEIANVIQLAVAPVFLLAGVGAIINALVTRLNRIVDRARLLEHIDLAPLTSADVQAIHDELAAATVRARLINRAIILSVGCALMVTLLIAMAFVGAFIAADIAKAVATAFVIALLLFSAALVLFLREVQLATRFLRIGHKALAAPK